MEWNNLVLAAVGGYLLGFVAHHISRCAKTPGLVIVTLSGDCLPKEAGVLLCKAATQIKRFKPGSVLSGLVFKGEGAVYTPEAQVNKVATRFLVAARLCGELENTLLKECGNQIVMTKNANMISPIGSQGKHPQPTEKEEA